MFYLRVDWHHEFDDEPIKIFSELNADRWEVRKVEVFRDGRRCFLDANVKEGNRGLSIEPIPTLADINIDEQFSASEITMDEFEVIWAGRQ